MKACIAILAVLAAGILGYYSGYQIAIPETEKALLNLSAAASSSEHYNALLSLAELKLGDIEKLEWVLSEAAFDGLGRLEQKMNDTEVGSFAHRNALFAIIMAKDLFDFLEGDVFPEGQTYEEIEFRELRIKELERFFSKYNSEDIPNRINFHEWQGYRG